MGRPYEQGLDYFPFDVDFFEDEKIQFIDGRFGDRGVCMVIRLLCKVYKNGFFYRFGYDEQVLFCRRQGLKLDGKDDDKRPVNVLLKQVLEECFKRGIFTHQPFIAYEILTSTGVQKRYFEAVKRRQQIFVPEELCLISIPKGINVNIYSINDNINYYKYEQKTPKEKEKKEIEKEKESDENAPPPFDPSLICDVFLNNGLEMADANKFLLHYKSHNWKTKEGWPVKNWQAKAEKWALEEKEKSSAKKEKQHGKRTNNNEASDYDIAANIAAGLERGYRNKSL